MYMCTWCLWKKPHRKCSLKASTGTCSLKLQIVLCSSNNFIQFTVKKLWRRLVYWVTYLLSGPPGSKLDSCCCSLGRLEWFCPKLKYVCSNPDIKDEHLKHDKSNNKSLNQSINQSNCLFIHPSTVLLYFKVVSHKSYLLNRIDWIFFLWECETFLYEGNIYKININYLGKKLIVLQMALQ